MCTNPASRSSAANTAFKDNQCLFHTRTETATVVASQSTDPWSSNSPPAMTRQKPRPIAEAFPRASAKMAATQKLQEAADTQDTDSDYEQEEIAPKGTICNFSSNKDYPP